MVKKESRKYFRALLKKWGCSSAGRAPALQAGGQEFDPPHLHHFLFFLMKKEKKAKEKIVPRSGTRLGRKETTKDQSLKSHGLVAQVVRAYA